MSGVTGLLTWVGILALCAFPLLGSRAQAQQDCPFPDTDWPARSLYGSHGPEDLLLGAGSPAEVTLTGRPPYTLYYVISRPEGHRGTGAIAVKRTYVYEYQVEETSEVYLRNNIVDKEFPVSDREFNAYHSTMRANYPDILGDFHIRYYESSERSDDTIGKRSVLKGFEDDQAEQCRDGGAYCKREKVLLMRYRGIRPGGNCLRFVLLDKTDKEGGESDLPASIHLEIWELDAEGRRAGPVTGSFRLPSSADSQE